MGRRPSIDEEAGHALLAAYRRLGDKRAAAAEVGVSEHAAYRYFASIGENVAPVVVSQPAMLEKTHASLWDTRGALDENYSRILRVVERLDEGIVYVNGEYQTLTPVTTLVRAIKEIREHIKTSMDLASLLIEVEEVQKFQQAVIEAIGEADEPTQHRLVAKLRRKRALGLTLPGSAAS